MRQNVHRWGGDPSFIALTGGSAGGHLAGLAVERGCGRLEWSVLDWNEPAIAFYKKEGALPMDEWTVFRVTGEALHRLAEDSIRR